MTCAQFLWRGTRIGRFGDSEEIAAAVLYLCSPGAALPVDGGVLA